MNDLERMRHEYARRAEKKDLRYSWFSQEYTYSMQSRERAILKLLSSLEIQSIQSKSILEVGCGSGGVLIDFLKWGVQGKNLFGIELLYNRLDEAKTKLPLSSFSNANGEFLPFKENSFDIVLQFTALSSILDKRIRQNVVDEMKRVLRSDGTILWYDFWLNPTNPQTHGIQKKEIMQLFGDECDYQFTKITLAPPISRRLVPISWVLASLIEKTTIFNSHWLAIITKKN